MSLLSLLHSSHKLPLRSVSLIFNGFVVFIFKVGYRYCFINSAASALQWQYGCHSAVYLHLFVSLRHRLVRKEFACFYFSFCIFKITDMWVSQQTWIIRCSSFALTQKYFKRLNFFGRFVERRDKKPKQPNSKLWQFYSKTNSLTNIPVLCTRGDKIFGFNGCFLYNSFSYTFSNQN